MHTRGTRANFSEQKQKDKNVIRENEKRKIDTEYNANMFSNTNHAGNSLSPFSNIHFTRN